MAGGFKRSGLFGIIGVIVVAAIVVVIATTTGEGQANPKTTYALIFGVLAVFFAGLFALQRSDLNRASGRDVRESSRGAAEGGRRIDDPTTLGDAELWAAMAVGPIDAEAVKARAAGWEAGRRSQSLAMLVTLVVILTVPSMYLLGSLVPLLIGGPIVVLLAVWGSIRALMPGGELDRGYDNASKAMAPLGLAVTERPTVSIEMREPVPGAMGQSCTAPWCSVESATAATYRSASAARSDPAGARSRWPRRRPSSVPSPATARFAPPRTRPRTSSRG